jgi:hypothetical protein
MMEHRIDKLPVLQRKGEKLIAVDGNHTLNALKRKGRTTVKAIVQK